MKTIHIILGMMLLFLFSACGIETTNLSIQPTTDTTAPASTTTTPTAVAPNDIASKTSQAYQNARKNAEKESSKAAVKK